MAVTKELKDLQREYVSSMFGISYSDDILVIPEGTSGPFEVKDDIDIDNNYIFQTLHHKGAVVSDNNPASLDRHRHFLRNAKGRILISGLGLGSSLYEIIKSPEVEHVTIVEKEKHIIELVQPAFDAYANKVKIIQGDIFKYRPKKKEAYDLVYHAIWNEKKDITPAVRATLTAIFEGHCTWQGFVFFSGKGGPRRGSGRKPGKKIGPIKPPKEKRTVRKGIRYTPDEYRLLQKASEISGNSESAIAQQGAVRESLRIVQDLAVRKGIMSDRELRAIIQGVETD